MTLMIYPSYLMQIQFIFFDLFNTLVHFSPPREEIQVKACSLNGLTIELDMIKSAYVTADKLLSFENSVNPLFNRSSTDKSRFWAKYQQTLLSEAGKNVTLDEAGEIFKTVRSIKQELVLYDDVIPVFNSLNQLGLNLGIISNMDQNIKSLLLKLDINQFIDVAVTSRDAGVAKPNPGIFQYALTQASVSPAKALHIGDDLEGDVVGAINSNMKAILLDRDERDNKNLEIPVISSLEDLPGLVLSI